MNAPAALANEQSLLSTCKNKHWDLLQRFAIAEIALAERLGSDAPRTFGAKLQRIPDSEMPKKTRDQLIAARNLLAHARITVCKIGGELVSVWKVAGGKNELDARTFTRDGLRTWAKEIEQALSALEK